MAGHRAERQVDKLSTTRPVLKHEIPIPLGRSWAGVTSWLSVHFHMFMVIMRLVVSLPSQPSVPFVEIK